MIFQYSLWQRVCRTCCFRRSYEAYRLSKEDFDKGECHKVYSVNPSVTQVRVSKLELAYNFEPIILYVYVAVEPVTVAYWRRSQSVVLFRLAEIAGVSSIDPAAQQGELLEEASYCTQVGTFLSTGTEALGQALYFTTNPLASPRDMSLHACSGA